MSFLYLRSWGFRPLERGARRRFLCGPVWGASGPRPTRRAGWAGASPGRSGNANYGDAGGPRRATTAARSGHRTAPGLAGGARSRTTRGRRAMRSQVRPPLGDVTVASSGLRDESRCRVRIASRVPTTRRALPPVCARRPRRGTSRSGSRALIAWYAMKLDRMGPVSVRAVFLERISLAIGKGASLGASKAFLSREPMSCPLVAWQLLRPLAVRIGSPRRRAIRSRAWGALARAPYDGSSSSDRRVGWSPSSRSLRRRVSRAIPSLRAASC
jgi:hypothetical protein